MEASILMERKGKSRSESTERNSWPTAPVTPTTAREGAVSWRDMRTAVGQMGLSFGLVVRRSLEERKGWWVRVAIRTGDSRYVRESEMRGGFSKYRTNGGGFCRVRDWE